MGAIGIVVNKDGTVPNNPVRRIDKSGSTDNYPISNLKTNKSFNVSREPVLQKGSTQIELLYNGKSQNNISIQYREYRDEFVRPAYTQILSYNLDESSIIAYKSLNIEVLSATNSEIIFRVLNDGELTWM